MSTASKRNKRQIKTNGEKIGKYTKYQRTKRGMSLNQFARTIDVDPSFLQRLETGFYQGISLDMLQKLALGFEMQIEEFLRKCRLSSYPQKLPTLKFFLRERYQFPEAAIDDCQSYIGFLQSRYKKQIASLKKKHKAYWEKQT